MCRFTLGALWALPLIPAIHGADNFDDTWSGIGIASSYFSASVFRHSLPRGWNIFSIGSTTPCFLLLPTGRPRKQRIIGSVVSAESARFGQNGSSRDALRPSTITTMSFVDPAGGAVNLNVSGEWRLSRIDIRQTLSYTFKNEGFSLGQSEERMVNKAPRCLF